MNNSFCFIVMYLKAITAGIKSSRKEDPNTDRPADGCLSAISIEMVITGLTGDLDQTGGQRQKSTA